MSKVLRLFVYVDALGWQIAEGSGAFPQLDVVRQPVATQLGYSCACIPTILTGSLPEQHGHWNQFYRPRERPTFRGYRWLRHLPGNLRIPGRLQPFVSRFLKRRTGLKGYFSIYSLPLQRWHEFEPCEHENLFEPGAFPNTGSVIDDAFASDQAVHVSDWRVPESQRWEALSADLRGGRQLDWAFLYLADLDGVLHRNAWPSSSAREKIRADQSRLDTLLRLARGLGYRVECAVISDHGMTRCNDQVDLRGSLQRAIPQREGRDYQAFYDSTMARFWSEDPELLRRIQTVLSETRGVRLLSEEELRLHGVYFEGQEYGQVIALADPGVLIVPSDMGRRPLVGMHGYDPTHPTSAAVLLTNFEPTTRVEHLRDLRGLMSERFQPTPCFA
jgi:predicted AlkP superfamily pyrophosphatase or phosphodiesterase